MRLSAVAVGLLLTLVLSSGCGADRAATAEDAPVAAAKPKPTAPAGHVSCRNRLRAFLASIDSLRDELATGLSYDAYLHEVQRVRAAYDGTRARGLPIDCLLASGSPAERAFNAYIDAANEWGDCLATVSCSTESVEPKLQRKWAVAARLLSSAQQGLRGRAGG